MALKNWLLSVANTIVVDSAQARNNGVKKQVRDDDKERLIGNGAGFKMPLHYPRYVRSDYEKMEEWRLDLLLRQYGLNCSGDLEEKRKFAMGAFLWPDQL